MVGCSALSCRNSSSKGFVMVRFPRETSLRQMWAVAIGRNDWTPSKEARLCEEHFQREQWLKHRCKLKPDAVPDSVCVCNNLNNESGNPKRQPLRSNVVNIPYADHSYCQQVVHDENCFKMKKLLHIESETVDILSKNCMLEKELGVLTQLLKEKENVESLVSQKVESSTILAFDMMKKAESDSEARCYNVEEVKKGLKLRFSCGTSGLKAVSDLVIQQPSVRTLQRKTEHILFEPGIQHDILAALGEKLQGVSDPRDRDCNLFLDEMAIKQQICYDAGRKCYRGHSTLPGSEDQMACKCEVYMFGGAKKKWKQTVGWHATPSSNCNESKRDTIIELLKEADKIGLNVVSVVCDMGNRGLLNLLGFASQKNNTKFCIPNPAKPEAKLWVVPDAVHLFKSLKEMICSNHSFTLPADVCEEFGLKSNVVNVAHIEWLEDYQRGEDLKFVPKFKLRDIKTGHFSKMNFKSAYHMLSHKTGNALSYCVAKGVAPEEFETTAWFVKIMNRWRELMTSKSITHAFSKTVMEAYERAISHLKLVVRIFQGIQVQGGWKPIQTHVILATESVLEIQQYLLEDRSYSFVLMARFSQDIVENLFSVIRMQRPVPTVVEFKYRLKQCTLSQFMQQIKGSSYDYANTEDFIDLLLKRNPQQPTESCEVSVTDFVWISSVPPGSFAVGQEDILYRLCGYAIFSLIKQNVLKCEGCIEGLRHHGADSHPNSLWLQLTNYKGGAQFEPSRQVFEMLRLLEYNLRKWKSLLQKTETSLGSIVHNKIIPALSTVTLGTCHDVKERLLSKFAFMRLKQLSETMNHQTAPVLSSQLSSKTTGSKHLADNFVVNRGLKIQRSRTFLRLKKVP